MNLYHLNHLYSDKNQILLNTCHVYDEQERKTKRTEKIFFSEIVKQKQYPIRKKILLLSKLCHFHGKCKNGQIGYD